MPTKKRVEAARKKAAAERRKILAKRKAAAKKRAATMAVTCTCRAPKRHPDCQYCGYRWAGEVVCGECHENGIDGKVIRGTERRTCHLHKE